MYAAVAERFWNKVDQTGRDACWPWTAAIDSGGYGMFMPFPKKPTRAHRIAYELMVGPIPAGMTIDHLCRNRRCVNPTHLEAVTIGDNVRRAVLGLRRVQFCPKGHDTFIVGRKARGTCRQCSNDRERERQRAKNGYRGGHDPLHCRRGHPRTPENNHPKGCRACKRERAKAA